MSVTGDFSKIHSNLPVSRASQPSKMPCFFVKLALQGHLEIFLKHVPISERYLRGAANIELCNALSIVAIRRQKHFLRCQTSIRGDFLENPLKFHSLKSLSNVEKTCFFVKLSLRGHLEFFLEVVTF